MTPEWITAYAAAATLLVVGASAVAALLQLRHMRGANQIVALIEIRKTMESVEFTDALLYSIREFRSEMESPENRKLIVMSPLPRQFMRVRVVGNFFENLGLFVKRGVLSADLVCDIWGGAILRVWTALGPYIANRRGYADGPSMWDNFEYLASRAEDFHRRFPSGTYPRGVKRMPLPPLWDDCT